MGWSVSPGFGRFARLALVAGLMFGLATAGIELTRISGRIATVWLANGAVLALLFRSARREWLGLLLTALVANVTANLLGGDPPLSAVLLSLCNLVEIATMAILLPRHSKQGFEGGRGYSTLQWRRSLHRSSPLPSRRRSSRPASTATRCACSAIGIWPTRSGWR